MDDAGLARLADFPSLENLGLDETKTTDAGLEPLRRFAGLRQPHVEKTQVVLLTLRMRPNVTRSVRSTIESPPLIESAIPGLARLKDALPICKFFADTAEKKEQASPAR